MIHYDTNVYDNDMLTQFENGEEDAKEPGIDGLQTLPSHFSILGGDDGKVGALGSPQWTGTQPHKHAGRHHGGPHRVPIGPHPQDVAPHGRHHSPLVAQEARGQLGQEETGEHHGAVDRTLGDDAHALLDVEAALERGQPAVGCEQDEEADADQDDVLHYLSLRQLWVQGRLMSCCAILLQHFCLLHNPTTMEDVLDWCPLGHLVVECLTERRLCAGLIVIWSSFACHQFISLHHSLEFVSMADVHCTSCFK